MSAEQKPVCHTCPKEAAPAKGEMKRRDFLAGLGFGGLGILAAQGAVIGGAYVYPRGKALTSGAFTVGTPDQFPEGVTYVDGKRVFIVRDAEGLRAVSAVCTHLGCTVNWAPEAGRYECPCHGSTFDGKTGAVNGGPAPRGLDFVSLVLLEDGALQVDPTQPVARSQVLKT